MKRFLTILVICNLFAMELNAQVGINTTSPEASSVLDLSSTNQGFLVPRLDISNITSPAKGLMVYDTTQNSFCFYNGTNWYYMVPWEKIYNPGDATVKQFVSTDGINLGNVGIGTSSPESKFTVMGNLAIGKDSIAPDSGAYILGNVRMGENAGIANKLEVDGNINARGKLKESGHDLLPAGSIIMWSGSTIPDGWGLCDGSLYGTVQSPNLSGRFIVGSGAGYTIGNTGGAKEVTLVLSQMPQHNHTGTTTSGGAHSHSMSFDSGGGGSSGSTAITVSSTTCGDPDGSCGGDGTQSTTSNGTHTHTLTINNTPSNPASAHENRPPYYALAYIIKL